MKPVMDCVQSGMQGNALACLPLPAFMTDSDHRVVMWNPACARLTGTDAASLLGTDRHWSAFYGSQRPLLSDMLMDGASAEVMNDHFHGTCRPLAGVEGAWQAESIVRLPEGGRWVLWMASLCRSREGSIHGAVQLVMDITERRHHEEHRHLLAAIVESSKDAIIAKTNNGIVVSWNPAAQHIYGYTEEEMIGRPASLLMPDDKQAAFQDMVIRVARGGHAEYAETSCLRKDGGRVMASLSLSPIRDALGNVGGVSAIIRDITHEKEVESARRGQQDLIESIFKGLSDALLVTGPDLRITISNPATRILFGYSLDELLDQPLSLLFDKPSWESMQTIDPAPMVAQPTPHEVMCRRKDQTLFPAEVVVTPLAGEAPLGRLVLVRDITARKQAEQESWIRRQQLVQADKMASLGVLVSGVAHEINNPNHYVQMNSELIGRIWQEVLPILDRHRDEVGDFDLAGLPYDESRAEMTELLDGIFDGSERIRRIVQELRDYACDQPVGIEETVDLNAVLRSAEVLMGHMLRKSTSQLSIQYGDALPVIRGSVQRLEQVAVNLLQNACQSLPDRSCAIRVATRYDPESGHLILTVEDEGVGIDESILPHITNPFFTTRRESGGTGLGLAIASSIVSEHGGTIRFEPASGCGTRVTVMLPVRAYLETPTL